MKENLPIDFGRFSYACVLYLDIRSELWVPDRSFWHRRP